MRVLLMHRDLDFNSQQPLPRHDRALTQDLELETLLQAMAGDDKFLFDIARVALFSSFDNDVETILNRQEALRDCLKNPDLVRELYGVAIETMERKREDHMWGWSNRHPGATLSSAVRLLELFVKMLQKLRSFTDLHAEEFQSKAFSALLAMLQRELTDEYFATIQTHLVNLRFNSGVLVSASPGEGGRGANLVLHEERDKRQAWLKWLLGATPQGYTYHVPERDEAGARELSELRDRGIDLVANALAQSTDHILSFFTMLRTELAFYVCCLNLREKLDALAAPLSFPTPNRQAHEICFSAASMTFVSRSRWGDASSATTATPGGRAW